MKFLGHVITPTGIEPDPAKTKVVRELAPPENKGSLRAFLGLTSYYRRFINQYATISATLTDFRDGVRFHWTEEHQKLSLRRVEESLCGASHTQTS